MLFSLSFQQFEGAKVHTRKISVKRKTKFFRNGDGRWRIESFDCIEQFTMFNAISLKTGIYFDFVDV